MSAFVDYGFFAELALGLKDAIAELDDPRHPVPDGADLHAEVDFKINGNPYHLNLWPGKRPTTDDCLQSSPESRPARVADRQDTTE